MSHHVSEELMARLSAFVAATMGLHFPRDRWRDLERGLNSAVRESDFNDCETYFEWLMSSAPTRSQIENLASHLTVGETYFFRDRKVIEALGSTPKHVKGDVFEAKDRPNVPESKKPTPAQQRARLANIKKAQQARWAKKA